jgi:hypothetical protein
VPLSRHESNATEATGAGVKRQSHAATFAKVPDGRKQPIRGLWVRNERYYARFSIENPITGMKKTLRIPLFDNDHCPVSTTSTAVAELKRLRTQRADNSLPVLERTAKFADYAARYLESASRATNAKKPCTISKEKPTEK